MFTEVREFCEVREGERGEKAVIENIEEKSIFGLRGRGKLSTMM